MSNCTLQLIHSQSNECEYVKVECADLVNFVNFFNFYFCDLKSHWYYFLPIAIIILLLLFDIISSTCENYLAPPLTKIGKALHFSEALAGVTLIALANGGPDVIASFTAAGQTGGTFMAIGSIFGANLFTTTVVLFRCLLNTDKIIMPYQTITRDLSFFIITVLVIISFGAVGYINSYMAFGYFGVYVCYIGVVLFQERKLNKIRKVEIQVENLSIQEIRADEAKAENPDTNLEINASNQKIDEEHEKEEHHELIKSMIHEVEERIYFNTVHEPRNYTASLGNFEASTVSTNMLIPPQQDVKKSIIETIMEDHKTEIKETELFSLYARIFNRVDQQLKHIHGEWKKQTVLEKCYTIYEFPLNIARNLTIPAGSNKKYRKYYAILYPITVITMDYLFFGIWNIQVCSISLIFFSLPFQAILSVIVFFTAPKNKLPVYKFIFWFFGFLNGVMWVYYLANILMDLLQLIGLLTGIDPIIIGMTILAWGNSANDFFVDASLARAGYGVMAVTGVFAGQLFNLFIGFGLNLLRQTAFEGEIIQFSLFTNADPTINLKERVVGNCLIFGSLANLIFSLIYQCSVKFVLTKKYGIILAIGYAILFTSTMIFYFVATFAQK